MSNVAPSSDHSWDGNAAHDHARLHNGHVYNHFNNTYNYTPGQTSPAATPDQAERAWSKALLDWLSFAEIHDRREQVHEAHRKTFRWIFEESSETGFARWLSSGTGIFWINGKPASGKSTLMKYISEEPRFREFSNPWANGRPLVIGAFWFWAAGTRLQRSLIGLYRTLLCQILRAETSLCRVAFPDWQIKFTTSEPTIGMLKAAMRNVLADSGPAKRYLFLIDGLDEYERDNIDKTQLADLMVEMARSPKVKLLLSSRPETPFEIGFGKCPMLQLETLTKPDILAYVESTLQKSVVVRSRSPADKIRIDEIAKFIIDNAAGVFLWVSLVLSIALEAINSYEDLVSVRNRIMHLPRELDQLFAHIFTHRIPQHCRGEAFRCLLIVLEWQSNTDGFYLRGDLVAVAQEALSYEEACRLAALSRLEVKATVAHFPKRLRSWCQGLLECDEGPFMGVDFLHRTLFDYLSQERETMTSLLSQTGDVFDVYTAIMTGMICAETLDQKMYSNPEYLSRFADIFLNMNALAERSTKRHQWELVSAFDVLLREELPHGLRQTSPSVLARVVEFGGALCLQEAMRDVQASDAEVLSILLHSAVPQYGSGPFRAVDSAVPQRFLDNSFKSSNATFVNIEAAATLIEHGANPYYRFHDIDVWGRVLNRMSTNSSGFFGIEDDMFSDLLRILLLFAKWDSHQRKSNSATGAMISTTSLTGRGGARPGRGKSRSATVCKAIRESVSKKVCCRSTTVRECRCSRSDHWKRLAVQACQLLEPSEESTANASRRTPGGSSTLSPDARAKVERSGQGGTQHGLSKLISLFPSGLRSVLPSPRRGK